MEMEQLFDGLISIWCALTALGLLLYLPLKPHWSKLFSFWDAIIFYSGVAGLVFFLSIFAGGMSTELIISAILIGGGFAVAGAFTLIKCWMRCGNVIEAIFLPVIMLMMIGVFCLGLLCLMMVFIGIFQKPYLTWNSFE